MNQEIAANEIGITRIYNAPVAAVWDAWTDVTQVGLWWGPRGFTLTTHDKDLRPGGHWKYTMHGPDGVDYANKTHYFEVERHSRLVYDHGANDERPPLFRVTVNFAEHEGKTTMDMRMAFENPEVAAGTRKFIRQANGDSTWDRLAEYLAKTQTGQEIFVINRSFAAPVEQVFAMWSDPKQLVQWVAPTGSQMEFPQADIRSGGSIFYCMGGGGVKMYGRAQYQTVQAPETLLYEQQFCDQNGKVVRHPLAPTWPESLSTHVQLTPEGAGTRVTVTWQPQAVATAEELATFAAGRAGMMQGWTGSFDRLDACLVKP